jgi:hypothetical protein
MFESLKARILLVWAYAKTLFKDTRAETTYGSGGVIGVLVGIMVSLLIGIIVVQSLITSQTQAGWSASANSTWATLQSNLWVAMTLLVIIPIIVGAVIILSYVRRGM